MKSDAENAAMVSGGATGLGVLTGGTAGVAFLVDPIQVPLWFILAAVSLPTGDLLAVFRAMIGRRKQAVNGSKTEESN